MSKEKLENTWILEKIGEYCSHILEQLEQQAVVTENNSRLEQVRDGVARGFCLSSNSSSYPMNFIDGQRDGVSWKAKACHCLSVLSDEKGFLEISEPSRVVFSFCDFSYKEVETDDSIFQNIEMKIHDITNSYTLYSKSFKRLPDATSSQDGVKHEITVTLDKTNGKIAYIQYYCHIERHKIGEKWIWKSPDYDSEQLVKKETEEAGKKSIRAAQALERQYAEQLCTRPYSAYETSLEISNIYSEIYGKVSDEPALVEAYRREYQSAYYSSMQYNNTIRALRKMLDVKRDYPDVDYPKFYDIIGEIRRLEPLATEEGWRNHLR